MRAILSLSLVLSLSAGAAAQPDTVFVPGDLPPAEGGLNEAVKAVSAAGKLSSTVFLLAPNSRYVLTGTITVPSGHKLTIIAPEPGKTQETAPPRILWNADHSLNTGIIFDCFGNIALHNLWLLYATADGWQSWSSVVIEDSPDSINGQHADFNGVIFDYAGISSEGSGCVSVKARHFRGAFTDCYFRNCTDPHFRYYGRAVSFPFNSTGWHTDSLRFDHCTFANLGYVYMQENGEYGDYVWFNHCTFVNVVMYTLESGWWHWLNVSNSLFVNTFMWGDQVWERRPDTTEAIGGTLSIDSIQSFGFQVPFSEAERHILFTHSSYALEPWLRQYIESHYDGLLDSSWLNPQWWPRVQPMMSNRSRSFFHNKSEWPYVSMGPLSDSIDPGFVGPPTNRIGIKRFLHIKISSGADTTWAYFPQDALDGVWPLREDLSYSNPALLKAGMWGFPLGDLCRWFPQSYAAWKVHEAAEQWRITTWLTTGIDPGGPDGAEGDSQSGFPSPFELKQNYPNPFNGTSNFEFRNSNWGWVRVTVCDLLGRTVATLVDEQKAPGTYTVRFDAGGLASGVYLYRLTAGPYVSSKKMMILR